MNITFEEVRSTAHSDMVMEDLLMADEGYFQTKEERELSLAKKLFAENWKSFNIRADITNDGYHVGDFTKDSDHPDYCIIYVSFLRVIHSDGVIECENQLQVWNEMNNIIANYIGITL